MSKSRHNAFTLIEVLIVVVILGILASILVSQVSGASAETRRTAESSIVQTLRNQITLFRVQHRDANPTLAQFWTNMMQKTNEDGDVGTGPEYKYGPYLAQQPANPYNNLTTVAAVSEPGAIPTEADLNVSNVGFLYDVETGRIWVTRGR